MNAPPLRIASYNLQKCVGLDLRRRPDRSLQVIEDLRAQIVVLQEADKRLPPRPAALPHAMAQARGWQVVDFGEPPGSLGWFGNAMLLRPGFEVLDIDVFGLPGLEPRGAIRADLHTPLGPLRVVGTHLGLIRRDRVRQLHAITNHLERLAPLPTVLAGDFNEWGQTGALDHVTPGLQILPAKPSFPSPRPIAPLDRFAISPDLFAIDQGTHQDRPARVASDHLPVWLDFGIR